MSALSEKILEQGLLAVITPANGKQKALGATMAQECLSMQVCSAFSSHLPFRDHGKTATKIPKSTAAVYHRRTKEITPGNYAGRNVPDQRSPDEQSGPERRSIKPSFVPVR